MVVFFPEVVANDVTIVIKDTRFFSRLAVGKWERDLLSHQRCSFPEQFRFVVVVDVEL